MLKTPSHLLHLFVHQPSSQHEFSMAMYFTLSLMFLLMTADVDGQQDLGMSYVPSYVSALRGSTVRMFCIYPPGDQVTPSHWTKTADQTYFVPPNLCHDTNYKEKVQCHCENTENSSITLTNVTEADTGVYYCIFTRGYSGELRGTPGVQLDVTDPPEKTVHTSLDKVFAIVAGCVGFCIIIIIVIILIIKKRRTDGRAEYVNQTQVNKHTSSSPPAVDSASSHESFSADVSRQTRDREMAVLSDDTYTALNPASRTSADIYNTIRSDQCRATDGVYTSLELQSRSPEYETLAVNTH